MVIPTNPYFVITRYASNLKVRCEKMVRSDHIKNETVMFVRNKLVSSKNDDVFLANVICSLSLLNFMSQNYLICMVHKYVLNMFSKIYRKFVRFKTVNCAK